MLNQIKIYIINSLIVAILATGVFLFFVAPPTVSADEEACKASGGTWTTETEVVAGRAVTAEYCQCQIGTSSIDGACVSETEGVSGFDASDPNNCEPGNGVALSKDNCTIINYLVIAINFLSALAIMAIVASVMFAGYQYMSARDNPAAVAAAKKRIVWALVALALFVFGYGLLNFLVPGGVL